MVVSMGLSNKYLNFLQDAPPQLAEGETLVFDFWVHLDWTSDLLHCLVTDAFKEFRVQKFVDGGPVGWIEPKGLFQHINGVLVDLGEHLVEGLS